MNNQPFEILGVILEWKLRSTETDNQYCVLSATVPPGAMVPPHQHVEQEAFFMLEGTGEFAQMKDGELNWRPVPTGEMVNIPSNSLHGFRNTSSANMRCLITAHPNIENFFLEAGSPVRESAAPLSMEEIGRVLEIAQKHGQRFLTAP